MLERNEQGSKKKEMRSVKYQGLDHGGPYRPLKNFEFCPESDGKRWRDLNRGVTIYLTCISVAEEPVGTGEQLVDQ